MGDSRIRSSEGLPRPAATLEDVARSVKLHRTTVARALNHDPRVRPETRGEIEACARRLGYRMNPLVSTLMSSRRSAERFRVRSVQSRNHGAICRRYSLIED